MWKYWIIVCLAVVSAAGCVQQNYTGSVKVTKVDGKVTSIEANLPSSNIILNDRDSATRMIEELDSLIVELKSARDQMPVIEKKEDKKKVEEKK